MNASPEVVQAIGQRQTNFLPLIAVPQDARNRIDARVVAVQSHGYGWLYRHTPAVRTVVDFIARNVAQLAIRLYERVDDEEREQVYDHPAIDSLRYPNQTSPGEQFIFDMVANWCVYHNAYALKLRPDNSQRTTLLPIPSHLVGVIGQNHFVAEGYRIWRDDGTWFDVEPGDIIHWRGYNPDDQRVGISPLETLRDILAEDAAAQQASTELSKSGLAQPGWVSRPIEAPQWSGDAADRFQEKLTNELANTSRKYPILEEGMELHDRGVSPKDAEQLDGRRFTMEVIADIYGVPLGLLGLGGTQTQLADQHDQFYTDVLPPITEMFASYLDLSILQEEYSRTDLYFAFDLDEKLQGDKRIATLVSAAGGPILLRNEARKKLNLHAIPDGDTIITPMNVTVGGKPSPAVMPPQDPNSPPQDGSHRSDSNAPDVQASTEPSKAPESPSDTASELLTKGTNFIVHRSAQESRRDRYAGEFEATLRKFYERQERSYRSKSNGTKPAFDLDRWIKELSADLLALASSVVAREATVAALRFGLGPTGFDMSRVAAYLAAFAHGKAEAINVTTEKALQEEEPSVVFAKARNERAATGGMTFATQLSSFANVETAKQSEDANTRLKTWVVTSKNSVHPEMDGQTASLFGKFSNGLEYPPWGPPEPGHVACQCLVSIT